MSGGVQADVTKKVRLGASQSLRFDNGASDLKSAFIEADGSYRLRKYVQFGGGLRYYMDKGGESAQRLFGSARLRYRPKKSPWEAGFRTQLETTNRATDPSDERWRNRVSGAYEATERVEPFAAFELFVDLNDSELRRYRIALGVEVEPIDHWTIEAGYLYQADVNTNAAEHDHVLGVELSYRFER